MCININEMRIYERVRETDKQKQTKGESNKHYFTNTQPKCNILYLAKYGDILRYLFSFGTTSYSKVQENTMKVQLILEYKDTCKSFFPNSVRDKVSLCPQSFFH